MLCITFKKKKKEEENVYPYVKSLKKKKQRVSVLLNLVTTVAFYCHDGFYLKTNAFVAL